jgi:hypothetical protein
MIAALALAPLQSAMAQEQDGGGFDQTQVITGDRTLTVDKAFKITEMPNPIDISSKEEKMTYQLIPRRPAVQVSAAPIEPARIKVREPLEPIYQGYVKGGVGTYQSPFLEAMFSSERKRDFAYGVKFRHFSSNNNIKNVANSSLSQNELSAWGKKIFNKHSLESKVGFSRNVWHYYGFDPLDQEINKKDIQQRFETFSVDSKWKSYYRDSSKVNHDIDLKVYNLGDRLGSNEFGVFAGGELHAFRGNQFYNMHTGFDLISYSADGNTPFEFLNDESPLQGAALTNTNAIVHAIPRILLRKKGLSVAAGLGLYMQVQNIARFHAFPDAEVSYSLFDNIFIPYAGITGSVNRVSYRTLTQSNPWVLNSLAIQNSITRYRLFGGIRGSISDKLSFNASVNYDQTDNTPLFVNDIVYSKENRFSVIYDDISTLSMSGELTYANNEKWQASARVELLSYGSDVEAEAWHLPSHRITIQGQYNMFDKLITSASINWIGSREVKSLIALPQQALPEEGFFAVTLPGYLDLGLQVEYRYTSRLSGFIEAHNLAASNYDIYYRFPAQRALILGGARYSF